MMIKKYIGLVLFALLLPASAQEAAAEENSRPSMPDLFFTQEQRKQLELLRNAAFEDLDIDHEFIPTLFREELSESELPNTPNPLPGVAGDDFVFNSYIINKSKNTSLIWINNQLIENGDMALLRNFKTKGFRNGVIELHDFKTNKNYLLSVGQKIDGQTVQEKYPVIKVHRR